MIVTIITNGGTRLSASASSITTHPRGALEAVWLMRYELIENRQYFAVINADHIAEISYVE